MNTGLVQAIYDLWCSNPAHVREAKEIRYDVGGYPEIKVILTWDWDYDIEGVFLEIEATGIPAPPETQESVGWEAASLESMAGHRGAIVDKLRQSRVYFSATYNSKTVGITSTTIDGRHQWVRERGSVVYVWGAGIP